ncbi:DNA-binding NtrC family response regulator [Desulfobaculum xiamenense]|uniref:DNA-binding NtrC family response regulator n=1 Tax=Desulfobaculum xiamenense TaxID=995050 RepID=A0A846QP41_9BACT|nr:response regulator [Desulfobaculum xiamenense]NJB68063.1 DNA-binding NtrC family response regulator [Desulfobaculum xiamenense]
MDTNRINVLIVDDEPAFRDNMVRMLGIQDDITPVCADCGESALEILRDTACDVVLLDMKMPGLNAIGTYKGMRAMGCDAEVIVLTGHASVDDAMEMMRLGAFDYLLKPCPTKEIVRKIRWAFENSKIRRNPRKE